jgi:hypothetical protein
MVSETRMINLDGETNGIAIQYLKNKQEQFIVYKDKETEEWKTRLYKRLETANVAANLIVGDNSVKYFIVIDDKQYSLNLAEFIDGHWELFADGIRYIIFEDNTVKAFDFKYFVFDNGDTERTEDKLEGENYQYKLLDRIVYSLYDNFITGKTITSICKKRDSEYVVSLCNSTVKIHIVLNKRLLEINKERKERGQYCFKFIKSMDRYRTIYLFATRDFKEPRIAESEDKYKTVMKYFEQVLFEYYSDCINKIVTVENTHNIDFVEE